MTDNERDEQDERDSVRNQIIFWLLILSLLLAPLLA